MIGYFFVLLCKQSTPHTTLWPLSKYADADNRRISSLQISVGIFPFILETIHILSKCEVQSKFNEKQQMKLCGTVHNLKCMMRKMHACRQQKIHLLIQQVVFALQTEKVVCTVHLRSVLCTPVKVPKCSLKDVSTNSPESLLCS